MTDRGAMIFYPQDHLRERIKRSAERHDLSLSKEIIRLIIRQLEHEETHHSIPS